MIDSELTAKQREALRPEVRHIEAGPGSGKTRTVVERYRQVVSHRDRYAALVSFTNAAVQEAKSRLANTRQLSHPNFVGTFDSFFHRFVTTPVIVAAGRDQPNYLASWSDLPDHLSHVRLPTGGISFPLTAFVGVPDPTREDVSSLLNRQQAMAWNKLTNYSQNLLRLTASKRISGLQKAGVFSADDARGYAAEVLATEKGKGIVRRLAMRFSELIVDEFQDCDVTEYDLLRALRAGGMRVITVADPDQAIYGFRRNSQEDLYSEYRASVGGEGLAVLDECHRSSRAICGVVTSLRSAQLPPILASSLAPTGAESVHILTGPAGSVLAKANKLLLRYNLSSGNARVLAHSAAAAQRLLDTRTAFKGESSARRALEALLVLRISRDVGERQKASRSLTHLLISGITLPENLPLPSIKAIALHAGIDEMVFRVLVSELVRKSVQWQSPTEYAENLIETINKCAKILELPARPRLRTVFPKPAADIWESWQAGLSNASAIGRGGWQASTVHQAKGAEYDAVLLAVPSRSGGGQKHVLNYWADGDNAESRRVLYVGASRAKLLLMIWAEGTGVKQIERIFEKESVKFEVH